MLLLEAQLFDEPDMQVSVAHADDYFDPQGNPKDWSEDPYGRQLVRQLRVETPTQGYDFKWQCRSPLDEEDGPVIFLKSRALEEDGMRICPSQLENNNDLWSRLLVPYLKWRFLHPRLAKPFPSFEDLRQHLDLMVQFCADRTLVSRAYSGPDMHHELVLLDLRVDESGQPMLEALHTHHEPNRIYMPDINDEFNPFMDVPNAITVVELRDRLAALSEAQRATPIHIQGRCCLTESMLRAPATDEQLTPVLFRASELASWQVHTVKSRDSPLHMRMDLASAHP